MLRKTEKLVVTFSTTTAAMAMESLCRKMRLDGRLIPVPSMISAGCGLAWCADKEHEAELKAAMDANGIEPQGIFSCLL